MRFRSAVLGGRGCVEPDKTKVCVGLPRSHSQVLTVYRSNGEALLLVPEMLADSASVPNGVVWIDLLRPTHEEDAYVEKYLGIDVPTKDELKDIEPSSRLYMQDGTVYMTASLVYKADSDQPELTAILKRITKENGGVFKTIKNTDW